MPKVLFALRSDAFTKPGGDSTKVARYREALELRGWQSESTVDLANVRVEEYDVVHVINIDLPRENLHIVKQAKKYGVPVALSTIRHPFEGIRQMYKYGSDSFYSRTKTFGIGAERSVGLREQLKLATRRQFAAAGRRGRYLELQRILLDQVDIYLPMATGEAEALAADYASSTPMLIVRNGQSFSVSDEVDPSESVFDVVSVGRIEPRKNSLALAKAVVATGKTALFLGGANPRHKEYLKDFENLVNSSPQLSYIGAVKHQVLPSQLKRARAYVNPAWFEVVSQADVEAASLGIPVATTKYSYIQDALGPSVSTFEPASLVMAPDYLDTILASATRVAAPAERSWNECGADLVRAYEMVARP